MTKDQALSEYLGSSPAPKIECAAFKAGWDAARKTDQKPAAWMNTTTGHVISDAMREQEDDCNHYCIPLYVHLVDVHLEESSYQEIITEAIADMHKSIDEQIKDVSIRKLAFNEGFNAGLEAATKVVNNSYYAQHALPSITALRIK